MMRWLSLFWFKRLLMERSKHHRIGYLWALRELHQGKDPETMLVGHTDYFDQGALDAIRDWARSIEADTMWAKAAADYDDPLEVTQELAFPPGEVDPLEDTQRLPNG